MNYETQDPNAPGAERVLRTDLGTPLDGGHLGRLDVETYFGTLGNALAAMEAERGRLFVMQQITSNGVIHTLLRHGELYPGATTQSGDFLFGFSEAHGVCLQHNVSPMWTLQAIGMLKESVQPYIDKRLIGDLQGRCVIIESHENHVLHGRLTKVQGDPIQVADPEHDCYGVQRTARELPFIHIERMMLCPCESPHKG